MLDNETITQRLEALVPGIKVTSLRVLEGGISASSWLAEVEQAGEATKWVVRMPGDYRYSQREDASTREFQVLSRLNASMVNVPRPVAVESDESSENRKFYVMEFVEGNPLVNPTNVDDFLNQYACALARVHATTPPPSELAKEEKGWNPKYAELNEALHEGLIRETLAKFHRTYVNQPVLCHGDPWPGNIIWKDEKLQCFIDWEEAMIADPLFDVSICRLEIVWLLGPAAMEDWTLKFQSASSISFEELVYWDLCAALRPIRWVQNWAPAFAKLGREDVTAETMTEGLKWFIEDALERATGSKPVAGQ